MNAAPDFLVQETWTQPGAEHAPLRRSDLMQLRQCARARDRGVRDEDVAAPQSLARLVANGMARRLDGAACLTAYGRRVAGENASCRDGTERPLPLRRAAPPQPAPPLAPLARLAGMLARWMRRRRA